MRLRLGPLAAVGFGTATGLVWGLVFRRSPDPVLGWLGLAPLAWLAFERRVPLGRAALAAWVHGAVAWAISVPWIARTIELHGGLPRALAWTLFGLLCLYLGVYHLALVVLGRRLAPDAESGRSAPVLAVLGFGAARLVLEAIQGWLFSGFHWNLAAFGAVATPGALELTSWLGSGGLSWLVATVGAALALLVVRGGGAGGGASVRVAVGTVVVALVLLGAARLLVDEGGSVANASDGAERTLDGSPLADSELRVRLLQPDVPILEQWDARLAYENYRSTVALIDRSCAGRDTLLILPESALWPLSWSRDQRVRADLGPALRRGCTLLVNSSIDGSSVPGAAEGSYFNGALLLEADEAGRVSEQRYLKMHLVPFGEYVPLGRFLPFFRQLAREAGAFSPGSELALLDWRRFRLGLSICFEITFPSEVARRTQQGATHLVTITNDAWYQGTLAPWQHLRAARFRAAENRRAVLRAAITGISAVIDERGRVLARLEEGDRGALTAGLRVPGSVSLYARAPWLVPTLAATVLLAAIGSSQRRRRLASAPEYGRA